jgi:sulfite exporter TauE/SafE
MSTSEQLLLRLAVAISAFLASFSKLKKHFKVIKIVSGVILIIMGVLLLMNKMTMLIPRCKRDFLETANNRRTRFPADT